MTMLTTCPGCDSVALHPLALATDLKPADHEKWGEDVLVRDPAFASCSGCGLVFARRRQSAAVSQTYYDAFQELEHREYAVYPPPEQFITQQTLYAAALGEVLDRELVFAPHHRVLNIRAECGMHLLRLREVHGITDLYGLDHFDSNVRYGQHDLRLPHMALLPPQLNRVPFDPPTYDVVLVNHLLTHALDLSAVFGFLRSILAPDGVLVLYGEENHRSFLKKDPLPRVNNYHKQLFTEDSLLKVCGVHGWDARVVHCFRHAIPWATAKNTLVVVAK